MYRLECTSCTLLWPPLLTAGSCSIGGGTITTFDGYSHTLTGGPCTYVLALDRTVSKLVVYGTFSSHKGGKFANRLINVALYMGRDT